MEDYPKPPISIAQEPVASERPSRCACVCSWPFLQFVRCRCSSPYIQPSSLTLARLSVRISAERHTRHIQNEFRAATCRSGIAGYGSLSDAIRAVLATASGYAIIQQQCQSKVRPTGCSALRFDLGSEGLRDDSPVPHNKCVGRKFVRIVCCFCGPENIGVITFNASLLHRKRGARLCKLRNEQLERGV